MAAAIPSDSRRMVFCAGCGLPFNGEKSLALHLSSSRGKICQPAYDGGGSSSGSTQVALYEEQPTSIITFSTDPAQELMRNDRMNVTLNFLTGLRLQKFLPVAHVQHIKSVLSESVLPLIRQQLQQELQTHVCCAREELQAIINRCTDLFAGIETEHKEHAALKTRQGLVRRPH